MLKHGILSRYPRVFSTMAGSKTGRVLYLDGYAGPGRYADGSPGSPLIAVENAVATAQWFREVQCIFVEQNPAYAANLKRILAAEAPNEMKWRVWQGDVQEHVDAALLIAGRDPMLTFLDPFGTALDYETLTGKLLARPPDQPTEVLLNFNLEGVWRIGGLLTGDKKEQDSEMTLARLDRFLGDSWWREDFRRARASGDEGSASDAALLVAAEFQRRVLAETGFQSFAVPVRRRQGNKPLFLLLLFSRYPLAPWKFNEQVSLANAEWRRACWQEDLDDSLWQLDPSDDDLFGGTLAADAREAKEAAWGRGQVALEAQWVAAIEENLRSMLESVPRVKLGKNLREVYGSTLGLARDKHVTAAWRRLVTTGDAAPKAPGLRLEHAWISRAVVP